PWRRGNRDAQVERRGDEDRVDERELDADRATNEDRGHRPGPPREHAHPEPEEPALDGERIGEPLERVPQESPRQPTVPAPGPRTAARVRAPRSESRPAR